MARKRNRVMRFRITLIMARTLFLITLLLFSSPLFASDGVLEINHTCAMETGCFAGDTPGYPVTITEGSTSYVLTSKLIIANAVTTGIQINANNVSIDLNQFAIILSFCDDGSTSDCTPLAGTGVGVRSSGLHYGNSLKDGSIIGMGYRGVELGQGSSVTNLLVQWNRASGIVVGPDSIVTGNRVRHNGVIGILASGSVIENNHVSENDSDGISAGTSTVIGNVIVGNGESNSDHGIFCQRCLIRENNVYGNAGFGLSLESNSAYSDNTIVSNVTGTVDGGNSRGGNFCAGNGTGSSFCP